MKKRDYESPTRRPGSKAQLPQSVNTPTASSARSQRKPSTTAMQAATLARREDRPSASSSPRQTASSSAPKTTKSLALQFTPLSSNRIATSGSSHSANAPLQSAIRQCFTPRAPPSPRFSVITVSPHSKQRTAWPPPVNARWGPHSSEEQTSEEHTSELQSLMRQS